VYGTLSRWIGADGEDLLWVGRIVSSLGSVVGAALFVALGRYLARPLSRFEAVALGALGFVVWFGTQFIAWWVLSIRPDIWAAVFSLAGLYVALPALSARAWKKLLLASLLFFLAWTFKQSCILSFVGCNLAALVVARSFRALLALATPFALLVGTSLLLGGEVYRFNIVTVPAISDWHFGLMTEVLSRALPQNPWVLGFFPLALFVDWSERRRLSWSMLPSEVKALALVVLVSVALGTFALGREGSNKNHLFEGYVSSALASYWALHRLAWTGGHRRLLATLAVVALVPFVLFPVAQIVAPNRLGRTVLCTRDDARQLAMLSDAIGRLPKPLYTDDEIFSQPWHSSDNRYPAIVIDPTWYGIAKRDGVVPRDFPVKLFAPPRFQTVVQFKGHPELSVLEARGSACSDLPGSWFGIVYVACSTSSSPR
jgi:hypothetical protein